MDVTTGAVIVALCVVIVVQSFLAKWDKLPVRQETHVIPSRKIIAQAYAKDSKRAPKFKSDADLAAMEQGSAWGDGQSWEGDGNA